MRFRPSDNDGVTFGDFDESFNLHCRSDDPLKIVAVALVVSIGVAAFGIAAQENNSAYSWLVHVFTQPGSKAEKLQTSICLPLCR